MANNAYVTIKGLFDVDALSDDLRDLNERYWNDLVLIDRRDSGWMLSVEGFPQRLHVQLKSRRRLQVRHSCGTLFWWIDTLLREAIAAKYNGKVSDDGVPGKTVGEPDKLATIEQYVRLLHKHMHDHDDRQRQIKEWLIFEELSSVPEAFRSEPLVMPAIGQNAIAWFATEFGAEV